MSKYRIIKKEKIFASGRIETTYEVQRLYLDLFWLSAPIRTRYGYLWDDKGYTKVCNYRKYFWHEEHAKNMKAHLESQRIIKHNGKTIEKILDTFNQVYYINHNKIILKNYGMFMFSIGYEVEEDLEKLKRMIDQRELVRTDKTVI